VLLLWEGEDLSYFFVGEGIGRVAAAVRGRRSKLLFVGEGIGRVGRRHRGCTRRNLDRVLVEFSKEKT
jgi:hypothetical protein